MHKPKSSQLQVRHFHFSNRKPGFSTLKSNVSPASHSIHVGRSKMPTSFIPLQVNLKSASNQLHPASIPRQINARPISGQLPPSPKAQRKNQLTKSLPSPLHQNLIHPVKRRKSHVSNHFYRIAQRRENPHFNINHTAFSFEYGRAITDRFQHF